MIARELASLLPSPKGDGGVSSLNHSGGVAASPSDDSLTSMRPRSSVLLSVSSMGIGGGAEDSEDAEAMLELQKIMKLKNTADWGVMTMSLKSLSRRFSRKGVDIQDLKIMEEVSVTGIAWDGI